MKTIESSKLEWQVFQNSDDGTRTYCADGDGFVTLEEQIDDDGTWWVLCDQGEPVADINNYGEEQTLEQALEIAQNYLAATYNEIFKSFAF